MKATKWMVMAVAAAGTMMANAQVCDDYACTQGDNYVEDTLGLDMHMVYVPAGTFNMGANIPNVSDEDESCVHEVTMDGYYMSTTEITQAQWEAVMGTTIQQQMAKHDGVEVYTIGDNYPMYYVTRDEALDFCKELSYLTGKNYTLPTEAQWEYAARYGQSEDMMYSGSYSIDAVATYEMNSNENCSIVAAHRPNALGIYDMNGNVWEMCLDSYDSQFYERSAYNNPVCTDGENYVARGGAWNSADHYCRVTFRNIYYAEQAYEVLGFRVVMVNSNQMVEPQKVEREFSQNNYTEDALGVEISMVQVPGGTFAMGSDNATDEGPVRNVTVDGFYMSATEITQAQWRAVMGSDINSQCRKAGDNKHVYAEGDNYPMYYVSWEDAMLFCQELSRITGRTYTLPTEAQWEYAARAMSNDDIAYSGGNNANSVAWHKDNATQCNEVATRRPNALGLYDMSGNVWEWCADWYDDNYYTYGPEENPQGAYAGTSRVHRGGAYLLDSEACTVSNRGASRPELRNAALGFRIVMIDTVEADEDENYIAIFNESITQAEAAVAEGNYVQAAQTIYDSNIVALIIATSENEECIDRLTYVVEAVLNSEDEAAINTLYEWKSNVECFMAILELSEAV